MLKESNIINTDFLPTQTSPFVTQQKKKHFFNFRNSGENISYDQSDFDFDDFNETNSFVEIVKKPVRSDVNGIEIRGTEPFRQGVEIRNKNDFFLNTNYKIHSGKKGHRISRENYGFEDSDVDFLVSETTAFIESEVYTTLGCVQLHQPEIDLLYIDGNDQSLYDHGQLKNVIEPLAIRSVASFMSPYFPFEPNSFWGNLCDGNVQPNRSSDLIVTKTYPGDNINPFREQEEIKKPGPGEIPVIVYESVSESSHLTPFNDGDQHHFFYQKVTGNITNITDKIIYGEDDYLGYDEKSCTTGFVYDNAPRGVDSIAFGGQTYI